MVRCSALAAAAVSKEKFYRWVSILSAGGWHHFRGNNQIDSGWATTGTILGDEPLIGPVENTQCRPPLRCS